MFGKKYALTDGEVWGWYEEAGTIKEIVSRISDAKQFVIAIEYGKPRSLTAKEETEVQSELARRRSR